MKAIYCIVALIISLSMISFKCADKNSESKVITNNSNSSFDTTIIIRQKYFLQVPKNFTVKTGIGDDTEFLQIRNKDESILIEYETEGEIDQENILSFLNPKFLRTKLCHRKSKITNNFSICEF